MSVSFAGEEGSEAYQRLRLGDINYAIYEVGSFLASLFGLLRLCVCVCLLLPCECLL